MGMSMMLGKSNAWNIADGFSGRGLGNILSISYVRTAPLEYDVTVTIDQLTHKMELAMNRGEAFVCLANQEFTQYLPNQREYDNRSRRFVENCMRSITDELQSNISSLPCLMKVIKGKKNYRFHLSFSDRYAGRTEMTERALRFRDENEQAIPSMRVCGRLLWIRKRVDHIPRPADPYLEKREEDSTYYRYTKTDRKLSASASHGDSEAIELLLI